jgi:hypothetical protein
MGGGIYLVRDDGTLARMEEQLYESEALLQELLSNHSDLLAGEQISPDTPRRWLMVRREMGVPDDEDAGNRWSVDHLFLDQDGVPTIVEVKRSTDTRARREVVAQMLDYAANAVAFWPLETIQAALERRNGSQADLSKFLGDEADEEGYWQKVKTNLQAGKIRMLFVADEIPPELRRIVEFLNEQMDPAEMLAVEVKQFVGQGLQALVPRLVGQTAEAQRRKRVAKPQRQWDEASFFEDLTSRMGEVVAGVARRLLAWARERHLRLWWGKGAHDGSFFPMFDYQGDQFWTVSVWTYGRLEVQFQMMKPPFKKKEMRQELQKRLNEIPGVSIPDSRIDSRPAIHLEVLADGEKLRQFTDVLNWYLEQTRSAASSA